MKTEHSLSNFTIIPNNEDLILKILSKFDSLLEKDEYYNHQERLYRLNKAMSAIANAQNVEVSKFTESDQDGYPVFDAAASKYPEKIVVDLNKINEVLDNFLKTKDDQVNIIPQLDLLTSSSEDEKDAKSNRSSESIKKRILHNLYNYEIFLKGWFFERSLKDDLSSQPRMKSKEISNAYSNFSSGKIADTTSLNINDKTPSTAKEQSKNDASTFNGSTPIIKKSFFEDQNVKNEINNNNRRKSHNEELKRHLGMGCMKTLLGMPRRRSERIGMKLQEEEYQKICKSSNEGIISEFNAFLCNNVNNNQSENNLSYVSSTHNNSLFEKRSSIFKESNLAHIIETDEFIGNFSRKSLGMNIEEGKEDDIEGSPKSEEDEHDENI